ncbi:COP9 signalosome complex subunit 1 [Scaptodrosophila lebanonensis]|uniref:COP9 signalosome complex subunit 1 n=1 Tax=Drosophila lebanonensis TaxID=7225 RepID=A0A6J2TRJ8_DROLE|nr:COP9 signalosome complex subunit 1 [Scaptodrosophila lebanonensis]
MISNYMLKVANDRNAGEEQPNTCSHCPEVLEPQIDLNSYAQRYSDIPRLIRLKFIAQVCPKLRVQALELAIDHVKTTYNVPLYDELYHTLCAEVERTNSAANVDAADGNGTENDDEPSPSTSRSQRTRGSRSSQSVPYDAYWVEDNTMESTLLLQELDAELNFKKTHSGNSYKRRILEEMGDYHVKTGNLKMAVKFYARVRPFCTQSDNVINMFRNLIKVSIYMANWWHVLSYIDEAKQYAYGFENLAQSVPARFSCASGLANLGLKIYKTAAECFLRTPFNRYDYVQIVAPSDVGYYGGLCALATFDLDTLEHGVLNSEPFKPFFERAPKMWEILARFYERNFDHCLVLLHEIQDNMRVDVYLAPHVDTLYQKIGARIESYRNARPRKDF